MNVDHLPGDLSVPSFGPRMVCTKCGTIGADVRPNWRGRPLTDRLAVVELIGATTTKTGLKVESALDTRTYQKGIKISKVAMKCLDITGDQFHPEWNYTIKPRKPAES